MSKLTTTHRNFDAHNDRAARKGAVPPAPAPLGWFSVTTTAGEVAVQATSFRQAVRAALARAGRGAEVLSRPDGRPSVHRVSPGNARRIALTGAKRRWRDIDQRVTALVNRLADLGAGEGTLEACQRLSRGAATMTALSAALRPELPPEAEQAVRLAPRRRQGEVRLAARLLLRQRAVALAEELGAVCAELEAWAEEGEALLGRAVSDRIMREAQQRADAKAAAKAARAAVAIAEARAKAAEAAKAARAEERAAAEAEGAAFDSAMAALFAALA